LVPHGPKGEKRPADVIGNAVHVMRIATGEIEDTILDDGNDPAAVALGRKGGGAAQGDCPEGRKKPLGVTAFHLIQDDNLCNVLSS
jgi:hypothetical protein